MAELSVDKDLIDQSAILQSDKVIAMQKHTLSDDLTKQIIELDTQVPNLENNEKNIF